MQNNTVTENKGFISGFVAVLGVPNAGKSTLVNKLTGEKVSIVSPKPQTTRNKINGILTTENYQIIFTDTPGAIKPTSKLNRYMHKSAQSAVEGADIILLVIDALKGITAEDALIIEKYGKNDNFICLVNKIDQAKPENVMPALAYLKSKNIGEVYPISAKTGKNTDLVLSRILQLLPAGEKYYPEDIITDKTERFMAAEIIREKMLYYYREEVPHGIGINITKYSYDQEKNLTSIDAEIFCEKEGHKSIIIGKKGEGLKKIGESARREMEKNIGGKVFLSLWVKIKKDWRESDFLLNELGYNSKEI